MTSEGERSHAFHYRTHPLLGYLLAGLFLLLAFSACILFRCTLYAAFNYELRKRRATSCDLSPSDHGVIESQSNVNLQVSLVYIIFQLILGVMDLIENLDWHINLCTC